VSPPPPPPPPSDPFLGTCGIGYETCANSTDGCCVAGQNCCPTPGTGINGCCGFNQTCDGPGLCNPICNDATYNRPCAGQDQCCSASYPNCCPDNGGCCPPGYPVCCGSLCYPAGSQCGTSSRLVGSASVHTAGQEQENPGVGVPMLKHGHHRKETHRRADLR
jgi:hypothetical protein